MNGDREAMWAGRQAFAAPQPACQQQPLMPRCGQRFLLEHQPWPN